MSQSTIIRQQAWREEELFSAGFQPYVRKKQVVMARPLPPEDVPREIPSDFETLVADHPQSKCWDDLSLFFGGVHAVQCAGAAFSGVGDTRRGGVALTVEQR